MMSLAMYSNKHFGNGIRMNSRADANVILLCDLMSVEERG